MNGMYDEGTVVLSFFIAFLGSYASISACEQFRLSKIGVTYSRYASPYFYLVLMAISLGGVGIWCMHFVGMSAMSLPDNSGNNLEVRYDIGITLLSLALVIIFTLVGFYVSSHDVVFMKTKREIVEMFVEDAAAMSMKDVQKMKAFQMVLIIGTRAPQHLLLGGLITGSGVVVMHYLGMAAMRFQGHIVWNAGIITASIIIAFVASVAAFWILLRLLSIYPDQERLRLASAFTMAIAVCGMHYTGMSAAEFQYDASVGINIDSTMSSQEAYLSGILACAIIFAIVIIFVLADLRRSVLKLSTELYRADTFAKSIPASNSCSGNAMKYIKKRQQNKFNLGVLNDTATLGDHELLDDAMSVASDDVPPNAFQVMWYRFVGGRFPRRASGAYSTGSTAFENGSVGQVYPENSYNIRSNRTPQHSYHGHGYGHHRPRPEKTTTSTGPDSSNNSFNGAEMDAPSSPQISYKPAPSPVMNHMSTSYHAPPGTLTLPPLYSTNDMGIGEGNVDDEVEDMEKGCTREISLQG